MKLGCGGKHLEQSCKRRSFCQPENISEFDTMNCDELSGNHADFVDNNNNFQIDMLCYSFNFHVKTCLD